ncbi:RimK-like ATP-grasp domain-containing protein [Draconibacterium orientale]|uniref:RimK-like ATP-grasp domain-containing protein n=1 Tax=Draconibacterium orientale TaxID=1168034 RepID=X5DIM7_9BACT|nr:hypothetical protein [Draconibacterium orientale]AHW60969.1 hypothetical protein FH5T_18650 [Draconibacterium orientale]SET86633.1 RimK-like ATP-grasp domain-containing protein [Draconibacterium orientale]
MQIAIHDRSGSFSDIWIEHCIENGIHYKEVNCYNSNIISELKDCDGLMWHWDLTDYKSNLMARQLTQSLERINIKVFPDVDTSWHYDDKVGQKYLLEAIGVPLINTYVFFSKKDADNWLSRTTFPKVFKLRNGAGSSNVRLVKDKPEAERMINIAFGQGFSQTNPFARLKERIWMFRRDKNLTSAQRLLTGVARIFVKNEIEKYSQKEKGYIYFQDFIPQNEFDIRLVIVGTRCFGLRRFCRKGDFRASGSGLKDYDYTKIDTECIRIAFESAQKLNAQSVAFDFISHQGEYKIIELSYAFTSHQFPGFWDQNLNWHKGSVSPQKFMIEDFVNSLVKVHKFVS